VTNIYNPYKDVMVLGNSADTYIKEINNAFTDNSGSYTLIDLYTLFAKENLVNTKFDISSLDNINLDPHPSKEGHARIASAIIEALNVKHAPSEVKTGQVKSTAKNTITIKLSCPSGKSGYEIEFAPSEDGKWKKLKDTSKNKIQIKSGKLKSGKTYYFRARSYNNLNGVKYYSGYSKAKKAKIK
ncbi:MAG: fibronectin type III domain-containing protein, partial [Lachnospiraceae bacterium]|nr:fibronectin type III domain-containing protein [Lachnospiraceae bacterium]